MIRVNRKTNTTFAVKFLTEGLEGYKTFSNCVRAPKETVPMNRSDIYGSKQDIYEINTENILDELTKTEMGTVSSVSDFSMLDDLDFDRLVVQAQELDLFSDESSEPPITEQMIREEHIDTGNKDEEEEKDLISNFKSKPKTPRIFNKNLKESLDKVKNGLLSKISFMYNKKDRKESKNKEKTSINKPFSSGSSNKKPKVGFGGINKENRESKEKVNKPKMLGINKEKGKSKSIKPMVPSKKAKSKAISEQLQTPTNKKKPNFLNSETYGTTSFPLINKEDVIED